MAKRVTKGNLWGFIQSRPYASVADIRRLFMMEVDGAAALSSNEGAYYIGLPQEAADYIRQLWQEGRIILDLNPDVKARVVQGVYPARIPLGQRGGRAAGTVHGFQSVGTTGGGRGGAPGEPDGAQNGKRRRRRKRRSGEQEPGAAPVQAAQAAQAASAVRSQTLAAAGHE